MMKRLKQWLAQKRQQKPAGAASIPNPYRRFYTQNRSFEELVKNARSAPQKPHNKRTD